MISLYLTSKWNSGLSQCEQIFCVNKANICNIMSNKASDRSTLQENREGKPKADKEMCSKIRNGVQ